MCIRAILKVAILLFFKWTASFKVGYLSLLLTDSCSLILIIMFVRCSVTIGVVVMLRDLRCEPHAVVIGCRHYLLKALFYIVLFRFLVSHFNFQVFLKTNGIVLALGCFYFCF